MVDYNKRLVEVDEILNYLSEEDYEKIPKDIIEVIKENKDTEYTWKYDTSKSLKEQDVSRDTIAFLAYLNMEYLLNEQQKNLMQKIHEENEKKLELEKSEKYNPDDLFKNSQKFVEKEVNTEPKEMVVYKENIFLKIFRKIKIFFNIEK